MVQGQFELVRSVGAESKTALEDIFTGAQVTLTAAIAQDADRSLIDVNAAAAHGYVIGDIFDVSGFDIPSYNGNLLQVTAVPNPTQFTYKQPSNTLTGLSTGGTSETDASFGIAGDVNPNLGVFVHLNLGITTAAGSVIEYSRDDTNFVPIADGATLKGEVFSGFVMKVGDRIQFRPVSAINIQYAFLSIEN